MQIILIFICKQKTAYEIQYGLVGSEMCIRDSFMPLHPIVYADMLGEKMEKHNTKVWLINTGWIKGCLLYTSDAADERSSVDLGGRRIIKKNKEYNSERHRNTLTIERINTEEKTSS